MSGQSFTWRPGGCHCGGVRFVVALMNRYSFGVGVMDVLLCNACGTYVAATVADDEGLLAVVNVRGANLPGFEDRTPEPMVYENESAAERLARRKTRRMPAVLTEAQPNA